MKYPIGIQDFRKIREDGYVYIDKTALIHDLVKNGAIYFLSRPRRFGKSLLVSTLKYYFLGEKELFKGLAIDTLEKEWKQYPVFHLDFNGSNFTDPDELGRTIEAFVAQGERRYGKAIDELGIGRRFAHVLHAAHEQTGLRCVVLIDEYDKPLLDVLDIPDTIRKNNVDKTLEEYNREVLKGFYSVFKAADQDLQFVLLTGVTKFSQVSVFSGFNQPNDISMAPKYDALCGVTTEELHTVFAEGISELAESLGTTAEDMKRQLKRQYDGYHFSRMMTDVYNPFSLLKAFDNQDIRDFWFQTGTPSYLLRLLDHCEENVNELVGRYYDAQEFVDYKADVEKPLPMIYQSGYLTIKGYDPDVRQFLLDFPNAEVTKGFISLLSADYFKSKESASSAVAQMVLALKRGDTDLYRELLTSFLASIPYSARRHENEREQERNFQYTVYLLMRLMSVYTVYHEKQTSQGRADFIIETPKYVYIFEYKLNRPAAEAIEQIDKCGYAREYATDRRPCFKIGIAFSSETGTISDWACLPVTHNGDL
ncbi:AAA family ATPase [Segatella baroniae]|uniref:ATP-binding protein n=1 Tax=Segatella baroniae TaxID=305719 RepID=UPI0028EC7B71|nr:AAA family ATPase [Segatella baroniae]